MVEFAAIAQLAITVYFGVGQMAVGYYAIGQIAVGSIVFAQIGIGEYVWTTQHKDPDAVEFFKSIIKKFLP